MDNRGFIKIHRKLLKWEWYQDINTKVLFLHLLLSSNWEDRRWQGKVIKRGQYISTINKLSNEIGLTVKQVRRSLEHLLESGEVEYTGTNKYSIYTVVNYGSYQERSNSEDKPKTNRGQTRSRDIREPTEKEGKQKTGKWANQNLQKAPEFTDDYNDQQLTEDNQSNTTRANQGQSKDKRGATIKEVKEDKKYPPIVPQRVEEGEECDFLSMSFSESYQDVLSCWKEERDNAGLSTGLIGKNSKTGAMKLAAAIDRGEVTLSDARKAIQNLLADPEKRDTYSLSGLVNNFELWVNRSPPEADSTVQLNQTRNTAFYFGTCENCNYSITGFDEGMTTCPRCENKIELRKEV